MQRDHVGEPIGVGLVAAELGIAVVPASMRRSRFEGVIFRTVAGGAETILHVAWMHNNDSLVLRNFLAVADEVSQALPPTSA